MIEITHLLGVLELVPPPLDALHLHPERLHLRLLGGDQALHLPQLAVHLLIAGGTGHTLATQPMA